MTKTTNREVRAAELRMVEPDAEESTGRMEGYAAVFNETVTIYDSFSEVIEPGAFARSIKDGDIRALFDHDSSKVLGRTTSGTLSLSEDAHGLKVEIRPPDTQLARDLVESMTRGDINQMSIGFTVEKQTWDETVDPPKRTIHEIVLLEVSVVTFPAYPTTEIGLRSLEAYREENGAVPVGVRKTRMKMRLRMEGSKDTNG